MSFKRIFILIGLVLSPSTYAGHETGTVRFEHGQHGANATSPGLTFFYLDGGTKQSSATCSSYGDGGRWVIDNSWPAADIQMSILISAFVSGKKVKVFGSNNCSVWGDSETAANLFLTD